MYQQGYGQNQSGQNQQRMNQPPDVVTTKDLAYLKDAMSWELLAMKKAHYFARQSRSDIIRHNLDKAGHMHQQHYQLLLSHLDPNKTYRPH